MKSFLLLPFLMGMLYARPTSSDDDDATMSTEHVNVRKISGDIMRKKRSTIAEFPANMAFQFTMNAGDITLDLERSVNPHKTTPVYTIDSEGIRLKNTAIQNNFAVYQDGQLGASVLVKSPGQSLEQFELMGAFTYNGNHYQIEPINSFYRKKRDAEFDGSEDYMAENDPHTAMVHRVKRQAVPYGNFNGDELIAPVEGSGLNRPADSPPYPKYSGNVTGNIAPVIPLHMLKPDDRLLGTTTTEEYDSDILLPPSRSTRRRRDTQTIYIEYMVVADYKNLERWKSKVGGVTDQEQIDNAYEAMHEYYQFVINGIDIRFRTATANGPEIRIEFCALLVSTSEGTAPWIQNNKLSANSVDDAGVLLDFAMWKNSVIEYLPNHDHAGLFTGFDLATPSSLNPIGMGYLNSICHNSWAVSETEEQYNAVTVHIAAHELGHNIGTRHDGSGNSCPSSSLYLMAPRLPFIYNEAIKTNPWTFSTCSQSAIKTFIDALGSDSCLHNVPGTSALSSEVPGLKYSADQQCNMTYGDDASLCRDNLYYQWDSICYAMQCKKKGESSCVGRLFPFEGTPCGDKKWCQAGACVSSDDAPSNHATCLFGDDPNVSCSLETSCGENDFFNREVRCCGSCLGLNNTPTTQEQTTSTTTPVPSSTTVTTTPAPSSTTATTTPAPSSTTATTTLTTSVSTTTASTSVSTSKTTPSTSPTTSSTTSSTSTTLPSFTTTSPVTISSSTLSTPSTTQQSSRVPSSVNISTASSSSSEYTSTTETTPTSSPNTSVEQNISTTMPIATSTRGMPTTTTGEPPQLELTFELQTMISLFVTSAILI